MKKIIALVVFLILAVYFSGALHYKDRLPVNVYVNEINIGGMTLQKADKELAKSDVWDQITIKSDTEEFLEIKAEEIEYKYVNTPDLPEIFRLQNKWKWLLSSFEDSIYTTPISSNYNKDMLKNKINGIKELDKELLNANIVYSDSSDSFVIEPHSYEIKMTREEIFDLVAEAIEKRDRVVNIEESIEQPAIFEHNDSLIQAKDKANEYLNIQLQYDFGNRAELIDRSLLKNWITINGNEVDINPDKVKDYVAELARKYDTFGRARNFKTSTGENITISGGSYGWVTNRRQTVDMLIGHIKNGENKTIKPIYSFEALIRNSDDIGNSYVEIDLEKQMVYVYTKGKLRTKTQTVTGNISKGYGTPTGIYPINYKERDAILVGEDYESPVEYWMPFNGHIGLHDAEWRDEFGEDIYESKGSNGCINLPPENTKTIFDLVYPGMPIIVH